jgi:hypothetical protein
MSVSVSRGGQARQGAALQVHGNGHHIAGVTVGDHRQGVGPLGTNVQTFGPQGQLAQRLPSGRQQANAVILKDQPVTKGQRAQFLCLAT